MLNALKAFNCEIKSLNFSLREKCGPLRRVGGVPASAGVLMKTAFLLRLEAMADAERRDTKNKHRKNVCYNFFVRD